MTCLRLKLFIISPVLGSEFSNYKSSVKYFILIDMFIFMRYLRIDRSRNIKGEGREVRREEEVERADNFVIAPKCIPIGLYS